jgi:predicted ABC-type ATPase
MALIEFADFDRRPILVAIAGPNGAGKTTFYRAHLASAGLRFVNADVLAAELAVGPYEAARLADALRRALVERGESFVFETVFSDPVGDKVGFLEEATRRGYIVVLCYIGLSSPE